VLIFADYFIFETISMFLKL